MRPATEEEILKRYLLGELPQDEQTRLEENLLTENELLDELLIAEDELIDGYLSGALSETEAASFESHFLLPPERGRKLRFARALRKYIVADETAAKALTGEETPIESVDDSTPAPGSWSFPGFLREQHPFVRMSLIAAILLVSVSLIWTLFRSYEQRRLKPNNAFAVVLKPNLSRDAGELQRVSIPKDADALQLRLRLAAEEYPSYGVVFKTAEGKTILVQDNLKAETIDGEKAVVLNVPTETIAPGDYQLKLNANAPGGEPLNVGTYFLRITSK
jgi:hypothetical protein